MILLLTILALMTSSGFSHEPTSRLQIHQLDVDLLNIELSDFTFSAIDTMKLDGVWRGSVSMYYYGDYRDMLTKKYSFAGDSLVIYTNMDYTAATFQLMNYHVRNDTIFATEIEAYDMDTNVGFLRSHYKNRKTKIVIPICFLQNSCHWKGERMVSKIEKIKDIANIHWVDIQTTKLYEKRRIEFFKKDY